MVVGAETKVIFKCHLQESAMQMHVREVRTREKLFYPTRILVVQAKENVNIPGETDAFVGTTFPKIRIL